MYKETDNDDFALFAHENIRNQKLDPIKQTLRRMTPAEVLEELVQCREEDQAVLFRLLDKDTAIEVFDMMDAAEQSELIESFSRDEALHLISELDPDDLVRLLDELPAKIAKRFLEGLPREKRSAASRLMGYADDTVGRIMSPVYLQAKKQQTAAQALESIRTRNAELEVPAHTVYVTDETRHLEGVLPLSALVLADSARRIDELLPEGGFEAVHTGDNQEDAARMLRRMGVVELPVLDGENRLVGVLTADDAMDVIREETTDDMFDKVGLLDLTRRESDRSHRNLHSGDYGHGRQRRNAKLNDLYPGPGTGPDQHAQVLQAVADRATERCRDGSNSGEHRRRDCRVMGRSARTWTGCGNLADADHNSGSRTGLFCPVGAGEARL